MPMIEEIGDLRDRLTAMHAEDERHKRRLLIAATLRTEPDEDAGGES